MTRIDQIRARINAASKPTQKERRPQRWIGSGYSFQILTGDSWHSVCEFNPKRQPNHVADCAFIEAAPDDIEALLRVVEAAVKRRNTRLAIRKWFSVNDPNDEGLLCAPGLGELQCELYIDERNEDEALREFEKGGPNDHS